MSLTDRSLIASLLPPIGARVRLAHIVDQSGLSMVRAHGALIVLCCDGVATVCDGWVTRGRTILSKR